MAPRTALLVVAAAALALGCSKPQTPVGIIESSGPVATVARTDAADVSSDKPVGAQSDSDPTVFAHLVDVRGSLFVVLSSAPEERWAKGLPILVSKDSPVVLRREVDLVALPKSLTRHLGRSMRLVGARGEVCRGTLGAPTIVNRVEPHFGERQRWSGEEIDGVTTPPFADEQIAQAAWDMSEDGKLLVAELVQTNGICQDALFARAADLPAASTFDLRPAPSALATQAKAELRKLAAYAKIEEDYRQSSIAQAHKAWTEIDDADVSVEEVIASNTKYVWMSVRAGNVCEGFDGRLSVLWRVYETNSKEVQFELVHEGTEEFAPTLMVQMPGEKLPALVGQESMLRKGSAGFVLEKLEVPYLDCPC